MEGAGQEDCPTRAMQRHLLGWPAANRDQRGGQRERVNSEEEMKISVGSPRADRREGLSQRHSNEHNEYRPLSDTRTDHGNHTQVARRSKNYRHVRRDIR